MFRSFWKQPAPVAKSESVRDALLEFEETGPLAGTRHPFGITSAFEGIQIFGATGSGKTSGSGRTFALKFLERGFGGLVLTAKPSDISDWREYARLTNRADHFVWVEPHKDHFDFLNYELNAFTQETGDSLTQSLVSLFLSAMESGQERGIGGGDAYWTDALRQLISNAVDLVVLAKDQLSLQDIADVIRTAPRRETDLASSDWKKHACGSLLEELAKKWDLPRPHDPTKPAKPSEPRPQRPDLPLPRRLDALETLRYWTHDYPTLNERTRSIVVSSFTSKATSLLRRPMRGLISGEHTFSPHDTMTGKVVVLCMPVKTYGEVGRFAQILLKTVWQRAIERRVPKLRPPPGQKPDPEQRPVFIWADEAQYFVSSEDMYFQQTARDAQAATVYLTQNISNYYAVLGSGRGGTAATDSLLGNLQTKIFHQNGDPATNEWGERLFARKWGSRVSVRSSTDRGPGDTTLGDSLDPIILASDFTTLRKGGGDTADGRRVEAIIFSGGRRWGAKRTNYLRATFHQPERAPMAAAQQG